MNEIEDRDRAEALHLHEPSIVRFVGLCLAWAALAIGSAWSWLTGRP
jgi:hypothetical protein